VRTKIATFPKYGDAQEAKHKLMEEFPEKIFQVRNRSGIYILVERTYPAQNDKVTKQRMEKKRGFPK
jgi:hypothetical protein